MAGNNSLEKNGGGNTSTTFKKYHSTFDQLNFIIQIQRKKRYFSVCFTYYRRGQTDVQ